MLNRQLQRTSGSLYGGNLRVSTDADCQLAECDGDTREQLFLYSANSGGVRRRENHHRAANARIAG